jgi:hypothetical protein
MDGQQTLAELPGIGQASLPKQLEALANALPEFPLRVAVVYLGHCNSPDFTNTHLTAAVWSRWIVNDYAKLAMDPVGEKLVAQQRRPRPWAMAYNAFTTPEYASLESGTVGKLLQGRRTRDRTDRAGWQL